MFSRATLSPENSQGPSVGSLLLWIYLRTWTLFRRVVECFGLTRGPKHRLGCCDFSRGALLSLPPHMFSAISLIRQSKIVGHSPTLVYWLILVCEAASWSVYPLNLWCLTGRHRTAFFILASFPDVVLLVLKWLARRISRLVLKPGSSASGPGYD